MACMFSSHTSVTSRTAAVLMLTVGRLRLQPPIYLASAWYRQRWRRCEGLANLAIAL